jgi:transposase InsO family protein
MAARIVTLIMGTLFTLVRLPCTSKAELAMEVLALRQQLAVYKRRHPRPRLTDFDRLFWASLKDQFVAWAKALIIVTPDTVARWHREAFRKHWARKSARPPGRPEVAKEVRDLIRKMATANPTWGLARVHGELQKLGIEVAERTVARHMPKKPRPAPSQTWRTFIENHMSQLVAVDFFTVPTANFMVLVAFIVLSLDRRKVIHFNVTANPTAQWTAQQIGEAFPGDTATPQCLMRDRDGVYGDSFVRRVEGMGIEEVKSAPRSPWQNAIAERLVLSIRTELLDHVVVLNEVHARRLLVEYVAYHRLDRCHLALNKDCPEPRPVQPRPPGDAEVVAFPRVAASITATSGSRPLDPRPS